MITATQSDIATGGAALKAYVDQMLEAQDKGWEEMLIPESVFSTGATDALRAADASVDQTLAGRQLAAQKALRVALDATGDGGDVTDAQCAAGAAAVLKAVATNRAKT